MTDLDKIPRPRADFYSIDDRGAPTTELEARAEALAAEGLLTFGEALDKLTIEQPDLLRLHDAWRASVADGDYDRLPKWLHGSLTAALLKRRRLLENRQRVGGRFSMIECIDDYTDELTRQGLDPAQAHARARREIAALFADIGFTD